VFAAFLGFNPVQALLGSHVLASMPAAKAAEITGQQFFPRLISAPVHHGLVVVFVAAAGLALLGAAASALRGDRYVHADNRMAAVGDAAVTEAAAPPTGADCDPAATDPAGPVSTRPAS
jgi:hypothetical protein